jgi:gliding motility-associated-like protein
VNFLSGIAVQLGDRVSYCKDSTLTLVAPACPTCLFEWSTGSQQNYIEVTEPGPYWLKVTNDNSCVTSDTVIASEAKCECSLYLPSAFTPNHDGRNEIFQPVYYCDVLDYELKIFDRWGKLVYASEAIANGWNGTKNNTAVRTGYLSVPSSLHPFDTGKRRCPVFRTGAVVVTY